MQFIDLQKQYSLIKDDVLNEINQVLDSGQYIMGSKIQELETQLAKIKQVVLDQIVNDLQKSTESI